MLFLLAVLVFSGVSSAAVTIDGQDYHEAVIQRGDTRRSLARKYTGKAANWPQIKILNARTGKTLEQVDDSHLQPGDKALIPATLLKKTEPQVQEAGNLSGAIGFDTEAKVAIGAYFLFIFLLWSGTLDYIWRAIAAARILRSKRRYLRSSGFL